MQGHLIILEGVDGAGTTTHSQRLVTTMQDRKIPTHGTQEPSDGPMGALLRQTLTGRLVTNGMGGMRPPAWNTMALMFAADRLDHLESEVMPNLQDGVNVVCDRYYHSSAAYQSIAGGPEVIDWIHRINHYAVTPDLTIVLDVPPEVARERRRRRRQRGEIYDDEQLQRRLGDFYADLERHYASEHIVHVNADAPVEEVSAAIFGHVLKLRGEG